MDACWPRRLPHGLSPTIAQHAPTETCIFSTTTLTYSYPSSPIDTQTPSTHPTRNVEKRRSRASRKNKVGCSKTLRRISMSPATGHEKRGRMPKAKLASIPSENNSKKRVTVTKRKARRCSKSVGPGTRVGASKEIPITITISDSDNEILTANQRALGVFVLPRKSTKDTHPLTELGRFSRSYSISSPDPSPRSVYSPLNGIRSPTDLVLLRSSPPPSVPLPVGKSSKRQQSKVPVPLDGLQKQSGKSVQSGTSKKVKDSARLWSSGLSTCVLSNYTSDGRNRRHETCIQRLQHAIPSNHT